MGEYMAYTTRMSLLSRVRRGDVVLLQTNCIFFNLKNCIFRLISRGKKNQEGGNEAYGTLS